MLAIYLERLNEEAQPAAMIDYIVSSRRYRSSVENARVIWGPTMYRHGHKFDHAVVELAVIFRIHRPTAATPKPDFSVLGHIDRGGDEEAKAAFDEAVSESLSSSSSSSSSDSSSDGEAEANSLSSLKQNNDCPPDPANTPPPPADAPRTGITLMRCFGGGCFRGPGEPPCEICGGKAVALPPLPTEPMEPMVEEVDPYGDLTVEELYSRWTTAAKAGIETLPKRKAKTQWNRTRSVRTLNLIEDKIKELEAGARSKPDWIERSKQHKTAIRKSTTQDWRDYVNEIADALGKADEADDPKTMADCVRKLGGGGGGFCTTQPCPELTLQERAEKWASFGEQKFAATAAELARAPLSDLGTAASRLADEKTELTDKEIDFCRRALAKTKACGEDGIPAETFKEDGPLQRALYSLIRKILSAVRLGFRQDGDKEVSQPKTEAMLVQQRLAVTRSTEEEYFAELEHECEYCGKCFVIPKSLHQYQTGFSPVDGKPWCAAAHREMTEGEYEIEKIVDARGSPERGQRFYLVKLTGYDGDVMEETTWEPAEGIMETAPDAVDDFWERNPQLDRSEPREVPGEHRCPWCCAPKYKTRAPTTAEKASGKYVAGDTVLFGKGSIFETAAGLKRHMARCGSKPRSRAGTRSEKAMDRSKRVKAAKSRAPVKMEGDGVEEEDISFVWEFKYLGFYFQSDGDLWRHVEVRMAMAATAFGKLRHIWADSRLSRRLKLRIYGCYVMSVLAWGLAAWRLGEKEWSKLRWWNAKLLARLLQAKPEDYGETVRQQTHEPLFDAVAKLRARRLRWLGHTLRLGPENLLRRVVMGQKPRQAGSVLADEALPAYASMEELESVKR
eukprot:SAG31_NODE_621_length_13502_cov_18.057002_5_plen_845_part_00